uniref:DUF4219 domain-containing protein n=1 Tax=Peronospora matthiolae TaxID=2874970 RepID=A0AAV1UVX4_9STRA
MDASSLRISKFDGTNFHAWKFKMQMVLEERDLWEVVSGEIKAEQCETPVGPSDVQEEVKKGDGSDLSGHGRFPATVGPVGKWCMRRMVKLKTLAEQLEAVGAPVCEDDLVITLLGSLSDSYQFLITALESRSDTLSWELVTSRLLHEESEAEGARK